MHPPLPSATRTEADECTPFSGYRVNGTEHVCALAASKGRRTLQLNELARALRQSHDGCCERAS